MTIQGTKISTGGELRICSKCSKPFVFYAGSRYKNAAKVCPTCIDMAQGRPSYVVERHELARYNGVEIVSLPDEWEEFDTKYHSDHQCYRIDIKGSKYGASWLGRIVIYADKPYAAGDVVDIREMRAVHKVKRVYRQRGTVYGTVVSTFENTPMSEDVDDDDANAVVVHEERPYLVFEPSDTDPQYNLHWITRYSKTTLKGYGRQYRYTIDSSAAIASWRVYGGARSGRLGTTGVLAITDEDHPVIVSGSLDACGVEVIASAVR